MSVDGLVYSKDGTRLIAVPRGRSGSVTLPAGVTVIGENAFAGSSLTKAILPAGLTTIGSGAFRNSLIKELDLPATVTVIGAQAFANTHLQVLLLPAGITELGDGAFAGCAQLTSIALPAGITAIGEDTFRGCTALNTITIPASVTSIGSNAFDGCTGLTLVIYLGEKDAITVDTGNDLLQEAQAVTQQTVSVVAAPKPSTGKPALKWESVEGVKKYEVHRASSIDGKYKKLATVSSTSYTDSSASVGVQYFYKIKALYGKKAIEIGAAVSRCVCAQPKVKVSVSTTTGQPTLSWSKISGASQYVILRSESADGEGGYTELAIQKGVKFTDKTVQPDTIYYYQVKVIAAKENADCVAPAPQRVLVPVAKPVIKVKANTESGKPEITFAEVPGAVSYTLYRATSKKGTFKEVMTSEVPSFEDETAAVGKTYYYKVKAIGRNSQSAMSSYASVLCRTAQVVISVSRNDATGKAVIRWNIVSGAKKYEVYRATKENGKYSKIATTSAVTYQDTKATPGYTYFYRVYAVPSSSKAKSVASNIQSMFAICAQPTLKVTYSSTGQHTISWGKVTGAAQYEIWRADTANGEFALLATQTGTSFVDKDTKPDTCYYYKVNVLAAKAGANSVEAAPRKITRAISVPKISVTNNEFGKPVVSWNAVEGAVRYRVYRATSSKGTYSMVGVGAMTSFVDEVTNVGTHYYYKVTALGVNCETAKSSYDDAYGKLPTPGITAGGQDKATGKPVIQWNKVDGAKKYDIYRATKENGKYSKIKSGATGTSYTDSGAKNKTTYYYKVVAVASNTKANSAMSDWYSVTSGNISAKDAAIRKILIKMERYPNYLSYNAELLVLAIDLYEMDPDNPKYFQSVLTRMEDVSGNIWKIYEGCGNNIHLKPLKSLCLSADFPKFKGSVSNFVRQGRGYARDAEKIVIMYNVIREAYGLEKIGNGYN